MNPKIAILFKVNHSPNLFRYVIGHVVEVQSEDALDQPTWLHASGELQNQTEMLVALALAKLVAAMKPGGVNFAGVVRSDKTCTIDIGMVSL